MWDKVYNKIVNIGNSKSRLASQAKMLITNKKNMSKEQFNAQANQIIMAYEAEKGKENGKEKNNNSRGVQGINNQRYDVGGIQQSASNSKSRSISRRRSGELQRGSNRRRLSRNGYDYRNGVLEATEELLKIKEVNATSFFSALSEAKKKRFTYDKCVTLHDLNEYEWYEMLIISKWTARLRSYQ